jgi:hypothetical protein
MGELLSWVMRFEDESTLKMCCGGCCIVRGAADEASSLHHADAHCCASSLSTELFHSCHTGCCHRCILSKSISVGSSSSPSAPQLKQ